jgi:hypothetical protein
MRLHTCPLPWQSRISSLTSCWPTEMRPPFRQKYSLGRHMILTGFDRQRNALIAGRKKVPWQLLQSSAARRSNSRATCFAGAGDRS